jgi:hypothetical protein
MRIANQTVTDGVGNGRIANNIKHLVTTGTCDEMIVDLSPHRYSISSSKTSPFLHQTA